MDPNHIVSVGETKLSCTPICVVINSSLANIQSFVWKEHQPIVCLRKWLSNFSENDDKQWDFGLLYFQTCTHILLKSLRPGGLDVTKTPGKRGRRFHVSERFTQLVVLTPNWQNRMLILIIIQHRMENLNHIAIFETTNQHWLIIIFPIKSTIVWVYTIYCMTPCCWKIEKKLSKRP